MEELKKKVEKMAKQIEDGGDGAPSEDVMKSTNLPFIDQVMRYPFLDKFKVPRVDKYDGSGDPTEHIESF